MPEDVRKDCDKAGPRYLEVASVSPLDNFWAVVQSSKVKINDVQKPSVDPKSIISSTKQVIGTKILVTDKIRFASCESTAEDIKFNQKNRNYLLVVQSNLISFFQNDWALSAYSNAGAIVLLIDQMGRHPLFSHLGGLVRELDIPVLAVIHKHGGPVNFNEKLLDSLKQQPVQNKKFQIYANEFKPEGFIAEA